jgi:hypothetical protein
MEKVLVQRRYLAKAVQLLAQHRPAYRRQPGRERLRLAPQRSDALVAPTLALADQMLKYLFALRP